MTLWFVCQNDDVSLVGARAEPAFAELMETLDEIRNARPLEWFKRYAIREIARTIVEEVATGRDAPEEAEFANTAVTHVVAQMPLTRRRNRITQEMLADVARVYTEAHRRGEPPTEAVSTHFQAPYSTAARWVSRARSATPPLLGPPTGPHGGTWEDVRDEQRAAPESDARA